MKLPTFDKRIEFGVENDTPAWMIEYMGFKADIRLQTKTQPDKQILITLCFNGVWVEAGANHLLGCVINAKDKVGAILSGKAGTIGERREVFPDHLGFVPIFLKLQPFSFVGFAPQAINQGNQI